MFSHQNALYWDYAASTPLHPRVRLAMQEVEPLFYANPHAQHQAGQQARACIESARARLASVLFRQSAELLWTSGATEANNLVLKNIAFIWEARKKQFKGMGATPVILTTMLEHPSLIKVAQSMAGAGIRVHFIPCDGCGQIDMQALKELLKQYPGACVSLAWVNHSMGRIAPIEAIAALVHEAGGLLHVDAAQGFGKVGYTAAWSQAVDFMTVSAHKVYGPKGIGALIVPLAMQKAMRSMMQGGGQEEGLRAGTLAMPLIVGMAAAFECLAEDGGREPRAAIYARYASLGEKLKTLCREQGGLLFPYLRPVDDPQAFVPSLLSVSFPHQSLDQVSAWRYRINASLGSSCHSDKASDPVLEHLGIAQDLIEHSMRLSFGLFTEEADIDRLRVYFKSTQTAGSGLLRRTEHESYFIG